MAGGQAAIEAAITGRRSIRGFLPRPVPTEVLRRILAVASRAPRMRDSAGASAGTAWMCQSSPS